MQQSRPGRGKTSNPSLCSLPSSSAAVPSVARAEVHGAGVCQARRGWRHQRRVPVLLPRRRRRGRRGGRSTRGAWPRGAGGRTSRERQARTCVSEVWCNCRGTMWMTESECGRCCGMFVRDKDKRQRHKVLYRLSESEYGKQSVVYGCLCRPTVLVPEYSPLRSPTFTIVSCRVVVHSESTDVGRKSGEQRWVSTRRRGGAVSTATVRCRTGRWVGKCEEVRQSTR